MEAVARLALSVFPMFSQKKVSFVSKHIPSSSETISLGLNLAFMRDT